MVSILRKSIAQGMQHLFENNPFTWVYGASRSVLALGTLITMVFNQPGHLYDRIIFNEISSHHLFSHYNFFQIIGYEYLGIARILAIIILLVAMSGIYPRYTGVLQWWVSLSFFYASNIVEGGDQITAIITLLFIPVTLVDDRKWHWDVAEGFGENKKFMANLIFLIIAVQMAMLYLNAVTDKIYNTEEWRIGSAFYYYVNDSFFAYPDWMDPLMAKLLAYPIVVSSITWGTLMLELILFGILFSNKEKKQLLFPLAVGFHLMIVLFLGLASFFFAMLGGLIIYLIPTEAAPWTTLSGLKSAVAALKVYVEKSLLKPVNMLLMKIKQNQS